MRGCILIFILLGVGFGVGIIFKWILNLLLLGRRGRVWSYEKLMLVKMLTVDDLLGVVSKWCLLNNRVLYPFFHGLPVNIYLKLLLTATNNP